MDNGTEDQWNIYGDWIGQQEVRPGGHHDILYVWINNSQHKKLGLTVTEN